MWLNFGIQCQNPTKDMMFGKWMPQYCSNDTYNLNVIKTLALYKYYFKINIPFMLTLEQQNISFSASQT